MYLSSKPNRLTTTAKARLHHQTHKLDNIESRNKRPEESNQSGSSQQGPPSPSEVIVFNNTSHTGGPGRNIQPRSDPHVPNAEGIHRYMRETWERRMHEIKTQNLSVLYIEDDSKDNTNGTTQQQQQSSTQQPFSSATAVSSSSGSSTSLQNPANKGKTSPQHTHHRK